MSELKKIMFSSKKIIKNHNMIIKTKSVFSISANSEIENMWSVNKQQYQSKFEWENNKLKFQNFQQFLIKQNFN